MESKRFETYEEMSLAAAEATRAAVLGAVQRKGRCTVALTGGTSIRRLYELLTMDPLKSELPWDHVHFFWGDDRLAPPDHPESNQGLARKLLLTPLNLAETNIHPITMDGYSPDEAAQAYQDHLTDFFGVPSHGPFPGFDLTFLGLGRDGHVASIFPNSPVFKENKRWVAAVPPPDHIAPPLARITVTMPVLDASRRMLILTGLKGKEALLGSILAGKSSPKAYPAFWLQPQGRLSWFIHEE